MKRILLFCIILGSILLSCSKEYVPQNDVIIDGQSQSFDLAMVDSRNLGEGTDTNKCIYTCTFVASGLSITSTFPLLKLTFGKNEFLKGGDENFEKLIIPGSNEFLSNTNPAKGIGISYHASSTSPLYSSEAGEQNTGNITIDHVVYTHGNPDRTNFLVSFSCKLYNETNPVEFKTISGTLAVCLYPHF